MAPTCEQHQDIVERLARIETKLDAALSRNKDYDDHLKESTNHVEELHNCSRFCGNVEKAMWLVVPVSVAMVGKFVWYCVFFLFKESLPR